MKCPIIQVLLTPFQHSLFQISTRKSNVIVALSHTRFENEENTCTYFVIRLNYDKNPSLFKNQ